MYFRSILNKNFYNIITHKFYYGQGSHLFLNLIKRNYYIQIQTIWEDHSILQIQGLTGIQNFTIQQNDRNSILTDQNLLTNIDQKIFIKLQIPQDFSYKAILNGSIEHKSTHVSSKMRGNQANVEIISKNNFYKAIYLQNMQTKIFNPYGKVMINELISSTAQIKAKQFESKKISIANKINIDSSTINIRSLILPKSQSNLTANNIYCESIMGKSIINCDQLQIKRWYAQQNNIDVNARNKYKINVQTGSGIVKGPGELTIGRLHKGKIIEQANDIKIINIVN